MSNQYSLAQLGWQPFFQQQISLEEWEPSIFARVASYQRSQISLFTVDGQRTLSVTPNLPPITVGDWLLLGSDGSFQRLLERRSLFSRKAAGSKVERQLIAANIDTLFIVTSLNQDFSLSRIERYLSLAKQNDVEAVVVLSKSDLCDDVDNYRDQVEALDPLLSVVTVNSLDHSSTATLESWCGSGQTVALLGSSGVGKSTLINTLSGTTTQATASIREDDSKGRHTTTGRSLHLLNSGGLLLDTPGMRELQLVDCEEGVEETFAELHTLAQQCRFSDCQHHSEPGCAIQATIDAGSIDARRLSSYQKLLREQAFNSATLAERRDHDRNLTRYYRSVLTESKRFKEQG
ncbi:ribosome small subunit-dependent GTPase A [Solemya pervernicosa gill symbiont]|uniref:Small ribosomal subunit biogenesis GTPase RsgA n=2 Tax=Gammaproteobacteria incertae sedis TaxID=118884 RepID=A0A1T2L5N9_9GAMM|nr:ribosome small subunit-dependent GTPase A [Candidatus Reidiella endopervernicosa]OOZ40438.1 ribosome small subunit-dependent GTPase A [Solemya pervernicosa gill symbiont]QKQ25351.1 ribosome small subunit-dependent GTPase A [Candidatus Reidiella endopervernicosa]